MRKEPSKNSDHIDIVNQGDVFAITEIENGFGKLTSGGWIMLEYTEPLGFRFYNEEGENDE